jgi:hypothetical protein
MILWWRRGEDRAVALPFGVLGRGSVMSGLTRRTTPTRKAGRSSPASLSPSGGGLDGTSRPAVKGLRQIADGSLDAIREAFGERGRRRRVSPQDLGFSVLRVR